MLESVQMDLRLTRAVQGKLESVVQYRARASHADAKNSLFTAWNRFVSFSPNLKELGNFPAAAKMAVRQNEVREFRIISIFPQLLNFSNIRIHLYLEFSLYKYTVFL